jgi:hypothetical protein
MFQGVSLPGIGPTSYKKVPRNSMAGRASPVVSNPEAVYYANGATGGSVPVDSTEYDIGDPVTLRGNTGNLVRTGYTFAGWQLIAD